MVDQHIILMRILVYFNIILINNTNNISILYLFELCTECYFYEYLNCNNTPVMY